MTIQDCLTTAFSSARRSARPSYPSSKIPSLTSETMRDTLAQFHISPAMYVVVDAYKTIVLRSGILIEASACKDLRRLYRVICSVRLGQVDVEDGHSQQERYRCKSKNC